jgi:hypothetical protein
MNEPKPPVTVALTCDATKFLDAVDSVIHHLGAVLCAKCGAVNAAWRVGENGGACHVCGEQIDPKGAP